MYREFFLHHPMLALPVASLMLFILVFAGIVIRTLGRAASSFDAVASLPLDAAPEAHDVH